MKKQMLLASWAFFVLAFSTAYADGDNENKLFNDTIILTPNENTKVMILGDHLKRLIRFSRLDSLKTLLIEDVTKAEKQSNYPMSARITHYFISSKGRRRLKAEGEDFVEPEVDVEKERQSLDLDLPGYVYIIHDLALNYEYRIYVKEPQQLKALANENLNDALSSIAKRKLLQHGNFRVDLEKTDDKWNLLGKYRHRQDFVELSPALGIGLIGNQWAPTVGFDINFIISNKYGAPGFKLGIENSFYGLRSGNTTAFWDVGFYGATSIKILRNLSRKQAGLVKEKWAGLEFGIIALPYSNGGYKVGFVGEGFGVFNYSVDLMIVREYSIYNSAPRYYQESDSYNRALIGVTLMFPF